MQHDSEKLPVTIMVSISFYKIDTAKETYPVFEFTREFPYWRRTMRQAFEVKPKMRYCIDGYMIFERLSDTIPKKGGAIELFDDIVGSVWRSEVHRDRVFVDALVYTDEMALIYPIDTEDGRAGPAEVEFMEKMTAAGWTDLALVLRH
jgi:hypothetical protein